MRRWFPLSVALVAFSALIMVAVLAWPKDRFAVLRQFHPSEGNSTGPTPTHYLDFTVPSDRVRHALGIPRGKEGYFKLPDGGQACFMDFTGEGIGINCQVWVFSDPGNALGPGIAVR
ncbi:MAG: hypothetical protein ACHQ50_14670 [Fimbriimonadales bacterium]